MNNIETENAKQAAQAEILRSLCRIVLALLWLAQGIAFFYLVIIFHHWVTVTLVIEWSIVSILAVLAIMGPIDSILGN